MWVMLVGETVQLEANLLIYSRPNLMEKYATILNLNESSKKTESGWFKF